VIPRLEIGNYPNQVGERIQQLSKFLLCTCPEPGYTKIMKDITSFDKECFNVILHLKTFTCMFLDRKRRAHFMVVEVVSEPT
jgi:hypothetical protein